MYSHKIIYQYIKADWDNDIYLKLINWFWFDSYSVATNQWSIMKIQRIPTTSYR